MRQAKIESGVEEILREFEEARSDDFKLVIGYYIRFYGIFELDEIFDGKVNGLPSMESITRARRKVQEKYPELNDPEIIKKRLDEQLAFEDFYSKGE